MHSCCSSLDRIAIFDLVARLPKPKLTISPTVSRRSFFFQTTATTFVMNFGSSTRLSMSNIRRICILFFCMELYRADIVSSICVIFLQTFVFDRRCSIISIICKFKILQNADDQILKEKLCLFFVFYQVDVSTGKKNKIPTITWQNNIQVDCTVSIKLS